MRRRWTFLAVVTITTVLMGSGQAASANGGAYLELDRTHYLPGEQGTALAYVTVPERRESIFDAGPFYLFAFPEGMSLDEGVPIPTAAVRIGTFSVDEEKHQYELTASFTVPQLPGDFYTLGVCNDPCTISGFRESLSGSISIVATRREAELLTENSRLHSRVYQLGHDARRANRKLEATQAELGLQMETNQRDRELLTAKVEQLEASLASAQQRASDAERPAFDPWMVGAILTLAAGAAVLTFRRRRLLAAISDLP